jgi:hypothetical protein
MVISKIDEEAPTIIFSEESMTYIEGEDSRLLLKDVRATDNFDGDVSDTIIIEKILPYEEEQRAIVTYAAIDRSYNMVKVSRTVTYKTAEEALSISTPIIQPTPTAEQTQNINSIQTIEPLPTNSPETEVLDNVNSEQSSQNLDNMVIGEKPIMYLKTNQINIKINDHFQLNDFIAGIIDDKDTLETLLDNINKEGLYNRRSVGTYEMILYVIDSDGNESNRETVRLVVE